MQFLHMYLRFGLVTCSLVTLLRAQTPHVAQLDDIQFTLAPGLTVERVSSPDLVKWPVVADWDWAGRLVVVESGGVAQPIEEHNKQLLHRVVRLVDEDGDGRFDRRIVAADKLPFPEGVLCLGNSMLVSAPPHIWKLTDEDDDGVCESREIWFDGQTITGCANDLHGPYLGRDGWIYWCKGAFAEQTHRLLDGSVQTDSAAHIYRRRFSGGAIEPVMSGGMDNPVEVAFTPEGERFFTSTFLQHPGDGLRDGIAHAIYGGVYGKDHHVIRSLVRTGPLMPIMTQLGPAAPSGLICLEQPHLLLDLLLDGATSDSARVLVAASFNLQKITAHRLTARGATYETADSDLLVADRVDFHPTDVIEDADGSLLVIDTGGWYDLCCPTSRVDQQTAAGGIYRLRRQKHHPRQDRAAVEGNSVEGNIIDWDAATTEDCLAHLHDARPWVARMASLRLAEAGQTAITTLTHSLEDATQPNGKRLRCLWALSAIGGEPALAAITTALEVDQMDIVHAACQAIAVHRYQPAREALERVIITAADGPAATRGLPVLRAAAEALGRLGDGRSIAALMNSAVLPTVDPAAPAEDIVLSHSLLYAMLEIADTAAIAPYLDSPMTTRRANALLLLDRLGDRDFLTQQKVLAAAAAPSATERALAISIIARHPEWIESVLATLSEFPTDEWLPLLQAWNAQPHLHQQMAVWLARLPRDEWVSRVRVLIDAWPDRAPPEQCVPAVLDWLNEAPHNESLSLGDMNLAPNHCEPLVSAIQKRILSTGELVERLQLIAILPANHSFAASAIAAELAELCSHADRRQEALVALQRMHIDELTARRTLASLSAMRPRELPLATEIIASAKADDVDALMLSRLPTIPAARTLPASHLENLYRHRDAGLQQQAKATQEQLAAPEASVAAEVERWSERLPTGDPVRGLEVFRGSRAACASCHQLGYVGGRIGPELSRIGDTRTREAILESILFPSSRIEQSYQSVKLLTVDGQIITGLRKLNSQHDFEIQLTADRSIVVPPEAIERQETSPLSIMPAGMHEVLTPQEIADLLALLQAARG